MQITARIAWCRPGPLIWASFGRLTPHLFRRIIIAGCSAWIRGQASLLVSTLPLIQLLSRVDQTTSRSFPEPGRINRISSLLKCTRWLVLICCHTGRWIWLNASTVTLKDCVEGPRVSRRTASHAHLILWLQLSRHRHTWVLILLHLTLGFLMVLHYACL